MPEERLKTFRDRPDNIDEKGKRKKILARQPKGKWYTRRSIVAYFLLLFFVLAPIIKIGNHPFMLLDVINRKFHLFGITVYSQDTEIMAIIMAVTVVFIVLFTVVFGRFWCGWACPHTVFLEMVYRRIEYLFHGNYRNKVYKELSPVKKSFKHFIYILVTLFFTNVFIMWFTGYKGLATIWRGSFSQYWQVYTAMFVVTAAYYYIYSQLRENVCTLFCPYGRMQGVLLDSKSITVAYDYKRGEPRGSQKSGDCINCGACISVCPTGIDIKNGTQLECVNCTACIDECNLVMKKIKRPKNLIRYASSYGLETGKSSIKNLRTYAYTGVLIILLTALIITLSRRTPIDTSLLRMPGTIFQDTGNDSISNIYQLNIVNKTEKDKLIHIEILKPAGASYFLAEDPIVLKENGSFDGVIVIKVAKEKIRLKNTPVELGFYFDDQIHDSATASFISPKK